MRFKPKSLKYISCGCDCCYYRINSNTGLKVYFDRDDRDLSFFNQKKFHKFRLAPMTKERFSLSIGELMGYISGYDGLNGKGNESLKVYCYITQNAEYVGKVGKKAINKCVKAMEEKGFPYYDNHEHNFGKIGKRVVCIDFCDYYL